MTRSGSKQALHAKLQRMRREMAAPKASGAGVPAWLRERLERGTRRPLLPVAVGPVSLEPPERLVEEESERGAFAARTEWRGNDERHGTYLLAETLEIPPDAFRGLARDGSLDEIDLRRAVYLDIETTGLSGGAGVYPFLVALGTFRDGGFEVWQGFLRSPEEEAAMLAATAARIADSTCMVSFFGKSFDRHRLEDKMRLFGIEPPFEGRPHLDLYHPCARLYRPGFQDGRLATMERELCGVEREDDLSGAFAPAAWFDFLAGRPHRLPQVFQHNLDDVLSLATLAAHLGRVVTETRVDGTPLEGPAGMRAMGLARLAVDRGDRSQALHWVDRALERLADGLRPVRLLRADLLRLSGEPEEARSDYERLAEEAEDENAVAALLELAKDAEHRQRDLVTAADRCARARVVLERACTGRAYARFKRDLDKREERVLRKRGEAQ